MSVRVAVLLGGTSVEREVSLVSGRACTKALRDIGYDVEEIEVTADVGALLAALDAKPDVVFNALHGRWGEDGCVQGLLELLHLPYTHSGVLASALAMNKQMTRHIAAAAGLRVPEGIVIERGALRNGDPFERPYVVKPLCEGSSVGVQIVQPGDNLLPTDESGWSFGDQILVERFVPGRELTVAVMGERALAVTEIRPRQGFYDYGAKYTEGRAEHLIPAPLPEAVTEATLLAALTAHRELGCRGVTRSDFRFDDSAAEADPTAGLYFLEINTQPGMTPLSLVPEQAAHLGISFAELCGWMVEHAACDS